MLINANKLTMAPDGITVFLIKHITSFLLRFPLKNITPMQIHAGITKANTSKKLYQLNLDCNVSIQRIREAIISIPPTMYCHFDAFRFSWFSCKRFIIFTSAFFE